MKLLLKKNLTSLVPVYDSDREFLKKLKQGQEVSAEITRPRNLRFHKKFFALLNLAFQNQDQFKNFEDFRFVMIMRAGFYEVIPTGKGDNVVYKPKSISFANMDEDEFERVYQSMLTEVTDLLQIDSETINSELESFY